MPNTVYVATSLDGYIADRDGGLGWLESTPHPAGDDLGFAAFMEGIDALVMGRVTFETVLGFDCAWPYTKPVFVLSTSLTSTPAELRGKGEVIQGSPDDVSEDLARRGFTRLYVDGGRTIQGFLEADRIDELILTTLPVLLGGGTPLFGVLPATLAWDLVGTEVLLDALVQSRYRRKRS